MQAPFWGWIVVFGESPGGALRGGEGGGDEGTRSEGTSKAFMQALHNSKR